MGVLKGTWSLWAWPRGVQRQAPGPEEFPRVGGHAVRELRRLWDSGS